MAEDNTLEWLTYEPSLAQDFLAINEEWIEEMFTLEETDRRILEEPQERIIDPGGQILFAKHKSRGILGCCALMKHAPGVFELTKMGVRKEARGLKVGEQLLQRVLQLAQEMPIQRLFLLTSHHCEAAIHLYAKNGFEHDAEVLRTYGCSYERCDVAMKYGPIWDSPGRLFP